MCHNWPQRGKLIFALFLLLPFRGALCHNAPVKIRKTVEIKARVDERTKAELLRLASLRELDISDVLREAVRDLLQKQRSYLQPNLAAK